MELRYIIAICLVLAAHSVSSERHCPSNFDHIDVQDNFDEDAFQGTWYSQFQTSYSGQRYLSEVHDFQEVSVGVYNMTYVGYSTYQKACKKVQSPRLTMMKRPANYIYRAAYHELHLVVVYTNYEYALVAMCFGTLHNGACDHSQLRYSIWSRGVDIPPSRVMKQLNSLVQSKLCIPISDLHETVQGLCDFPHAELAVHVDESRSPPRPGHIIAEHHSNSIEITWSPSNDVSVIISGYYVSIGSDIDHMVTHNVSYKTFFYRFDHLNPDTDYLIKIQGYNHHGAGTPLYKHVQTDPLVVGKCNLDQLTIQPYFNLNRFLGKWHLQRETTFLGDNHIWKSLTMRLSVDDNGVLHMSYAGTLDQTCVHVQDAQYNEIQPGFYEHHTGSQDSFMKIHYTDYNYAIVDICLGSTYDRHCNRSEEEVEIWSHDSKPIPSAIEANLKNIVVKDLCVNYDEMVSTTPGMCALPAAHKDSDCLFENVEVQENFDKNQFSGKWYSLFSTSYVEHTKLHSAAREYGVDENGDLHMSFSGVINGVCTSIHDIKLHEIKPGYYDHPGKVTYFQKVVYTDYSYALVEWCLEGNHTHCTRKDVEIWSRTKDPLPKHMETSLEDMASGNLCIPPNDIHHLAVGECPDPILTMGQCNLDSVEVQDHFNISRFLGTWHLREETHYIVNDQAWKSLTMRLSQDDNGVLHMAYAGMLEDTCIHVQDTQYNEIQPGYYEHHTGIQDSFLKVHYTDYHYAVVDVCLGGTYDRHCNTSLEEVEIWSRTDDEIPDEEEGLLRVILTGNLCVKEEDLINMSPGLCALPAPHHTGDCLLANVPVQENFDMNKFSGRWYSVVASKYWNDTIIHSETRRFGVAPDGSIHMSMSEYVNDVCVTLNDEVLHEIEPGFYSHQGHSTYYMKVHYTDYHYAVVEMCYGDDHMVCTQKEVEVWSRDKTPIPVLEEIALEDIVSGNLCVPPADLHVLDIASCADPVLAIGDRCNLDRVKSQADFEIKMFLGRWYSRYSTNFQSQNETLLHLKRTFSLDANGTLHMVVLGETTTRCIFSDDVKVHRIAPGLYSVPNSKKPGYFRIHFTDYTYGIMDICFDTYSEHHCSRDHEQVEIISRHQDPIPEQELNLLDTILDSNLCIKLDDMAQLNPVDCFTPHTAYYGQQSHTETGRTCQRWDSKTPHEHKYGHYYLAMENYCRTFDHPVPWCYTNDPAHRWENCSVPLCVDCDGNNLVADYAQCEFVHAQPHFDQHKFEGLWHIVSSTTHGWQNQVFTSSSMRVKFDANNTMHTASSSLESGHTECIEVKEYQSKFVKPGIYGHTNGVHTYVEISFTDYHYAIVYSCFGADPTDHRCAKDKENIAIWARKTTPIPELERHHLDSIISRDYCLDLTEMHDLTVGSCEVPEVSMGQCDLDTLSVQKNFNLDSFLGVWYLHSDTHFQKNDKPWQSLTMRWSVDGNNNLHVAYAGILELDTCIQVQDSLYTQLSEPGYYQHHTEYANSFLKIHYTDYHYAVVDVCFGKDNVHHCNRSNEEVQILSRDPTPIVPLRMTLLKSLAAGDLCIGEDDFFDVQTDQCTLPSPHTKADCSIDHVKVQENFDITKFNGIWHSRISTKYGNLQKVHSEAWNFGQDANHIEYVSLAETVDTQCVYMNDMQLIELEPGFYEHKGSNHFYMKVHFTDYNYAVVETCDGATSATCVHKQVEIWSRDTNEIPLHIKISLEDTVHGNLCIPSDDLHELDIGNCQEPVITAVSAKADVVHYSSHSSSFNLRTIFDELF